MNLDHMRVELGIDVDFSKFKDDQGRWRTQSLFQEIAVAPETLEKYPPVYSLAFFGKVYVQLEDPTGYLASQVLLNSWEHWKRLLNCPWFAESLKLWNDELDARLQAKAIETMKNIAEEGGAKGTAAAKWLAEKGFRPKRRGAPSQAEINKAAREKAENDDDVNGALERLGLKSA